MKGFPLKENGISLKNVGFCVRFCNFAVILIETNKRKVIK